MALYNHGFSHMDSPCVIVVYVFSGILFLDSLTDQVIVKSKPYQDNVITCIMCDNISQNFGVFGLYHMLTISFSRYPFPLSLPAILHPLYYYYISRDK